MKTALFFSMVFLSVVVCAQDKDGISKPKPKAPSTVDTQSPVTKAEARAVLIKAASVLKPVLKQRLITPSLANSSNPVTRSEIVAEFSKLFISVKPAFKYTPKKVTFDRTRLTLRDQQRSNLERLITFGTVAKLGPVAAGDKPTLTVREFGDAVGFFLARVADLTHLPSARWTPGLQVP